MTVDMEPPSFELCANDIIIINQQVFKFQCSENLAHGSYLFFFYLEPPLAFCLKLSVLWIVKVICGLTWGHFQLHRQFSAFGCDH